MAWSNEFLAAISDREVRLAYRLETIHDPGGTSNSSTWRSFTGTEERAQISRVGGFSGSVTPGSWSSTQGAWSVEIAGSMQGELVNLLRGSLGILYAGRPEWDASQYQPIAIGILHNIKGRPPRWALEFWGIFAGLQSRRTTSPGVPPSTPAQFELFYDVGTTTTIDVLYTAADTDLDVTDETIFELETSGTGLVKVTPNTGDDAFYLTYTGTSSGQLTGVATTAALGTVAVDAPINSVVTHCAYLDGHPVDILRRILASTGAGTNGTWDDYPASWGFGIADDYFAHGEIAAWRDAVIVNDAGGTYNWTLVVEAPVGNGIGWLTNIMAEAGIWPVVRQGLISVRAAQDPDDSGLAPLGAMVSGIHIQDDDIIEILSWEAFDSSQSAVAGTCAVSPNAALTDANATERFTVAGVHSMPAIEEVEHDLTEALLGSGAAQTANADGDRIRLQKYDIYTREKLSLRCRPRLRQLVEGDLVDLTTSRIYGRFESTEAGYSRRRALVLSNSQSWGRAYCDITLAITPTWDEDIS